MLIFHFFRLKNTTGYPPFLVKQIDPFLADPSGSNLHDTVTPFLQTAQTVIQLAQCWWSAKDSKQQNDENHAATCQHFGLDDDSLGEW